MQITISNFQSIENVTLDINEGSFTCIVGQSNIGKSAIRRAIECVLYNKSDASYIRNGTDKCSVEIIFDDGMLIKWMRDEKSASYEINGEVFSKLSKTVPQPILDRGFREIDINKEKLSVQVASQFDNIFLLNMTGSKVTDVFSNLGNLNKIINANKACTSDLKQNKGRISLRKEDFNSLKEKIKKFNGLDEQRNLFELLKSSFDEIKNTQQKKEILSDLYKKFEKSENVINKLKPIKSLDIDGPNLDISKFAQAKKLLSKLITSQNKVIASGDLTKIKDICFDINPDTIKNIKKINSQYEIALKKNKLYSNLASIPSIGILEDGPLYKINPLKELLAKLDKSKKELLNLRTEVSKIEKHQEFLDLQKSEIHKDIKVCPLCDKEF